MSLGGALLFRGPFLPVAGFVQKIGKHMRVLLQHQLQQKRSTDTPCHKKNRSKIFHQLFRSKTQFFQKTTSDPTATRHDTHGIWFKASEAKVLKGQHSQVDWEVAWGSRGGGYEGGGSLVTASFGRLWPQVLVACDRRNCYSVTFRGRRNIWSCWSFTSCGKRIIWWCWSATFVGRGSIGWNLGRQLEHNVWWGVVLEQYRVVLE